MIRLKDFVIIIFNTLLLLFIISEIYLRLNQEHLLKLNAYLPNTETTLSLREIIIKKNTIGKSKFIFNNKHYDLYTSKKKKTCI